MSKKPTVKTAAKKKALVKKAVQKQNAAAEQKKEAVHKAAKKVRGSLSAGGAKKSAVKKISKKVVSDKEKIQKEANRVINSSPKAKNGKKTKRPKSSATESDALVAAIVEGMQEKKAKNITVLNLTGIQNRVSDYFVISDAESNTHVEAIADSVEEIVKKKTNEGPYHSEGYTNKEWILLDYINVVAHVFQKEIREYYNLEGMWADAEVTVVKD